MAAARAQEIPHSGISNLQASLQGTRQNKRIRQSVPRQPDLRKQQVQTESQRRKKKNQTGTFKNDQIYFLASFEIGQNSRLKKF